ncbi:MAG: EamA/RhaT family transporter, partial [Pseudomonadota bacterium]
MDDTPSKPLYGIGLKILSVALFMAMATCIKSSAALGVPAGEAMFFRSLFAIPVILIWLVTQHDL